MNTRCRGFTLAELMVSLTVAGILATAAVPSFRDMVNNNRITSDTNRLLADIRYARSEALKRNMAVALCRSAAPTAAAPVCGGTANTWTTGWLVFTDAGAADGTFNGADVLLRIGQAMNGTMTVMSNAQGDADLRFNADGTTSEGGNTVNFAVCDDRGASKGKLLQVSAVGRPRLAAAVTSCTTAT